MTRPLQTMETTLDRKIQQRMLDFLEQTEYGSETTDFWSLKADVEQFLKANKVNITGYITNGKWQCGHSTVAIPLNQLVKKGVVGIARQHACGSNIYYLVRDRHRERRRDEAPFPYSFIQEEHCAESLHQPPTDVC